jgi:hypothetical protein
MKLRDIVHRSGDVLVISLVLLIQLCWLFPLIMAIAGAVMNYRLYCALVERGRLLELWLNR